MSPKRATDLVKGIIVDLDNALASNGREALPERHSALASAGMLAMRLVGGMSINLARIATSLERMERHLEAQSVECESGSSDGKPVADEGEAGATPRPHR